jgi:hypothetical protein
MMVSSSAVQIDDSGMVALPIFMLGLKCDGWSRLSNYELRARGRAAAAELAPPGRWRRPLRGSDEGASGVGHAGASAKS